MTRRRARIGGSLAVCLMLGAMPGCGGERPGGPLHAMSSPVVSAAAQEIPNPLRGQYADMLIPLFPQNNPAQKRYPDWPDSFDGSIRVSWRELQPVDPHTLPPGTPDEKRFDFHVIDDALARQAENGVRLTLRVVAYNSCCNEIYPDDTNIAVPDWVRTIPGATTSYPGPPEGSSTHGVTQVVPNWNDPGYLGAFEQLLAALGRRYDSDERLSVFEFSGYGDFSENHNAYLRDALHTPGPSPDKSIAALGYHSLFRDQNITKDSIQRLVAAHVRAFGHTQLVTTLSNPEIVRQLLSDDITAKLSAPVGSRSDCLGYYSPLPLWAEDHRSWYVQHSDPLIDALTHRFAIAPVITEWCDITEGISLHDYYRKGLRDVAKYHVSMTSSVNFPDAEATSPMDPQLYLLWAQANALAGYRYSVEAREGSQSVRDGVAAITVTWTNVGAAASTENWVPEYRLVDFTGTVVRTLPSIVNLKTLVQEAPRGEPVPSSATETVRVDVKGLPPGHYTMRAAATWQQHKPNATHEMSYPPIRLARDGRDDSGYYPIAALELQRDESSIGHG